MLIVFFFQAEDGIRDIGVTGVQTCALPIFIATKGIVLTIILFFLPVLGGYSRIYLSQHFLSDVLGGSLIGFIIPCLMFCLFYKKQWMQKTWFNQHLLPINKGKKKI